MRRHPSRVRTARVDERGVTIPVVALMMTVLILAVALGIDTGRIAVRARDLQKVADLAALDGVRELNGGTCAGTYQLVGEPAPTSQYDHVLAAVRASARRNGVAHGVGDQSIALELGTVTYNATTRRNTFSPLPSTCTSIPNGVRVVAVDQLPFAFGIVAGFTKQRVRRSAVAKRAGEGAFEIGSSVASLDTASSTVLDAIVGKGLCPAGSPVTCTASLTLVGYQGLASGSVSLGAVAAQLGLGNPSQLAGASATAGQLFAASARALGCTGAPPTMVCGSGASAGAAQLATLANTSTNTTQVSLGRVFSGQIGGGEGAGGGSVNALGLVSGTALLVNGTNAITVPALNLNVAGVTSAMLSLSVVEGPRYRSGPVGASATTSQVNLTLTPTLAAPISTTTLQGELPIKISGGGATGTLTSITCEGTAKGITVGVATNAADVKVGSANLTLASALGAAVIVNGTSVVAPTGGGSASFAYPAEYYTTVKHVSGTSLALGSTPLTINLTGALPLGLVVNSTTVANVLTPILTQINQRLSPALDALGIDIGGADVRAQDTKEKGNPGWTPGPTCGLQALA